MKRIALALLTAGFALAASAQELFEGYTCCNLHYDKDWISDANWGNLPKIPAGTPIKVTSYGWNRAAVEIDGKPMRLGHDYGRNEESLEVGRKVVRRQPGEIDRAPKDPRRHPRGRVCPHDTRAGIIAVAIRAQGRRPRSSMWHLWPRGRALRGVLNKGTVDRSWAAEPSRQEGSWRSSS